MKSDVISYESNFSLINDVWEDAHGRSLCPRGPGDWFFLPRRTTSFWATQERVGTFPEAVRVHSEEAFKLYRYCLSVGVPRELARSVLPVNTYSRMFATVNLHNLFHFLRLRLDPHSQFEIRVYAEAILQLIEPVCPVAVDAFKTGLSDEGTSMKIP